MVAILGLHGSHGRPSFIRDFAKRLAPDCDIHCPQGRFPDGDGFTFFRRNPDFSIPLQRLFDLATESLTSDGPVGMITTDPLLAIGYSSGAIFATALLAVEPARFSGAILLRPQPLADDFRFAGLAEKPVLILSGLHDARRKPHHADTLARQLSEAGADVTHYALDAGHGLAEDDADLARSRDWMKKMLSR